MFVQVVRSSYATETFIASNLKELKDNRCYPLTCNTTTMQVLIRIHCGNLPTPQRRKTQLCKTETTHYARRKLFPSSCAQYFKFNSRQHLWCYIHRIREEGVKNILLYFASSSPHQTRSIQSLINKHMLAQCVHAHERKIVLMKKAERRWWERSCRGQSAKVASKSWKTFDFAGSNFFGTFLSPF